MKSAFTGKIALGTANFGLHYGVKHGGQVSREMSESILQACRGFGIDTIDTAIGYGDSQKRLGEIGTRDFKVITKLPALPNDFTDVVGWVIGSVDQALIDLQREDLYGLLLHSSKDLLSDKGSKLAEGLQRAKTEYRIHKLGVSVYSPEELLACAERLPLELVQVPCNVFDQRFLAPEVTGTLKAHDAEIHARSLFLQGLLLMPEQTRPHYFNTFRPTFESFQQQLTQGEATPLEGCLAFAYTHPEIDRWVIGVDSVDQLNEIVRESLSASSGSQAFDWHAFHSLPQELVNPSLWRLQ